MNTNEKRIWESVFVRCLANLCASKEINGGWRYAEDNSPPLSRDGKPVTFAADRACGFANEAINLYRRAIRPDDDESEER